MISAFINGISISRLRDEIPLPVLTGRTQFVTGRSLSGNSILGCVILVVPCVREKGRLVHCIALKEQSREDLAKESADLHKDR